MLPPEPLLWPCRCTLWQESDFENCWWLKVPVTLFSTMSIDLGFIPGMFGLEEAMVTQLGNLDWCGLCMDGSSRCCPSSTPDPSLKLVLHGRLGCMHRSWWTFLTVFLPTDKDLESKISHLKQFLNCSLKKSKHVTWVLVKWCSLWVISS